MTDINVTNVQNHALLQYLPNKAHSGNECEANVANFVSGPHNNTAMGIQLFTQPDVLKRLWDDITVELPEECRAIVNQNPVLLRPTTGIIFGFAGGTNYCLRLPKLEFDEALASGGKVKWVFNDAWLRDLGPEHNSTLDLGTLGEGWIFAQWRDLTVERRWCLAAYDYAGATGDAT